MYYIICYINKKYTCEKICLCMLISETLTLQHGRCSVVVEGNFCYDVILLQLSDFIRYQNSLSHSCIAH